MKLLIKNKRTAVLRAVLLVLIFVWCTLIFCMSAETADISGDRSGRISEAIVNFVLDIFSIDKASNASIAEAFEVILRKGAHMFSYFVLALLSLCFFSTYGKMKKYCRVLSTVAFTLVYALSDEIHQLYVEGRSGSLFDVMIDMIGAVLGIILLLCIQYFIQKRHKQSTSCI